MANSVKVHIPNAITGLNLFSGCVGIVFAFQGQFEIAAFCILASGVFDFFDGLVARLLRVSSPMGKELDSLADVISFGLLPGVIYYQLLGETALGETYVPFLAFLVPVFSALRLAKFNLDERQQIDFIGLNTPMNAFYVLSLPFIALNFPQIIMHPAFLIGSIVVTSLLLVSEVRLFSLKFKSMSWAENRYKYVFLGVSAGLLPLLRFEAIPVVLALYFIFSFLHFRSERSTPDRIN